MTYCLKLLIIAIYFIKLCMSQKTLAEAGVKEVFAWQQISYVINGITYNKDTNAERNPASIYFHDEIDDNEKFFIQYNNVPVGLEVYKHRVFITIPRRRYGIPSTLNYIQLLANKTPALKPYPSIESISQLVSVYRPRVDACGRLWMVDTGLLEVPGARVQVQKPAVIVFDLETDQQLLRYELKDSDLISERSPGGFTSITVDVTKDTCDDAYAYITDLATEGLVVFSLKLKDSWRMQHDSFKHDEAALNFTVAGKYVINWKDGLFSVTLSEPNKDGSRTAFYHPMVSLNEFSIDTKSLKRKGSKLNFQALGFRGINSQSGSHVYHAKTRTIFYANAAQDAVLCWCIDLRLTPENVGIAVQDHSKLVYISDLKIHDDEVWLLVNQMPRFVFSTLDVNEENYFVHRAGVEDLIKGTVCKKPTETSREMTIEYS